MKRLKSQNRSNKVPPGLYAKLGRTVSKFIREYESDTFYGGDLTDVQAHKMAKVLIPNLLDEIDGVRLTYLMEEVLSERCRGCGDTQLLTNDVCEDCEWQIDKIIEEREYNESLGVSK